MLTFIKKHKLISGAAFLLIGVIIGLGVAVKSNIISRSGAVVEGGASPAVTLQVAGPRPDALSMQDAFINVAETVGPAVVSIVTEATQKIPARTYRFGPPPGFFRDDEFDRFFRDFFGEIPEREFKQQGLGSGVIIDKRGYIITNDHVINGADKITAILPDGRRLEAKLQSSDPRSDLAVIKIEAQDLPAASIGDSDNVRTGQWVVAIGNPFGFVVNNPKPTVTVGVVSALHRSLPLGSSEGRNYIDLIQTDAAINPGNSGGPLCDLNGNIIGLNVAIFSTTGGYQGVGFAIPANTIKWALRGLIEGKKVQYGWLGVTAQEMTYDMAEYFSIAEKKGVIVLEVIKGGPADKAGIKEADIIISINGKQVESLQSMLKLVGEAEIGKPAKIGIIRDGKESSINVIVGERPSEEALAGKEPYEGAPAAHVPAEKWRGLTVSEITDEIASRYGIEKETGVLITAVEAGASASNAGLKAGMVIKEINKQAIRNMSDYKDAIAKAKGSALIKTDKGYAIVKE